MATEKQKAARNRVGARRWYWKNREEHNALRRERYANNLEAREKARQRAAEYRASMNAGMTIDRKVTRKYDGKNVIVLSTGQVAKMLGRTPQMIRNWERGGLIPESVFRDTHRYYTKRQARLLITLLNTVDRSGGSWTTCPVKRRIKHTFLAW